MSRQELSPIPAFQIAPAGVSKGPVERPRSAEYMPGFPGLLNPGSAATEPKGYPGSATSTARFRHPVGYSKPTVSDKTRELNHRLIDVPVVFSQTSISRNRTHSSKHGVCKHQTIQVKQTNNLQGTEEHWRNQLSHAGCAKSSDRTINETMNV